MKYSMLLGSLSILLLFPLPLMADTIIFTHGRQLSGKVIPPEPDDTTVVIIIDGKQSLTLNRSTISRIEYDYPSRLAELNDTDYLGHYELGLWCLERQLLMQARERLLYADGQKDIPLEINFYLGRSCETIEPPLLAESLKNYERYLLNSPDGIMRKQAEEARDRIRKEIDLNRDTTMDEAWASSAKGENGLEVADWTAPTWGCLGTLKGKKLKSNLKNSVLEINYSDKNAKGERPSEDQRKTPVQLRLDRDLSTTPFIALDVYNPEKEPIQFSVAIETGSSYEWFETQTVTVPAEEWLIGIRFDLNRKSTWKAKRTGWAFGTPVLNATMTRNLTVLVLNGTRKGTLYLDSIKFEGAP